MKLRTMNDVVAKLIEDHNDAPSSTQNPLTEQSLVMAELEHLERMKKKGFTSLKQVIAYLQGRLEGFKWEQSVEEGIASAKYRCSFYSLFNGIVHCSKDYDQRGVIHKVTQEVCDMCWERQKHAQQQTRAQIDNESLDDASENEEFEKLEDIGKPYNLAIEHAIDENPKKENTTDPATEEGVTILKDGAPPIRFRREVDRRSSPIWF